MPGQRPAMQCDAVPGDARGTVMRGADALPGSKATSRATGSHPRWLARVVSGSLGLLDRFADLLDLAAFGKLLERVSTGGLG
jgi:hypothetical protein